jgi:hypothetical protein
MKLEIIKKLTYYSYQSVSLIFLFKIKYSVIITPELRELNFFPYSGCKKDRRKHLNYLASDF